MADNSRVAEIPIRFPTKEAEKDLKRASAMFKKTVGTAKSIEKKKSYLGAAAGGIAAGAAGYAFQSIHQSKSSAALQATGQTLGIGVTAALGTALGAKGAILGREISEVLDKFVHAIGEEVRATKDKSLGEVQAIVAQFSQVGASLSSDTIKLLLEEREKINKRVFADQRRTKNIQSVNDKVAATLGNAAYNKLVDLASPF